MTTALKDIEVITIKSTNFPSVSEWQDAVDKCRKTDLRLLGGVSSLEGGLYVFYKLIYKEE